MATKTTTADSARASAEPGTLTLVCVLAWAVPGAAHVWLGRRQKGAVFLVVLSLMFAIGLMLHGRIFPFEFSEPLVALAAIADVGLGVPWVLARMVGAGERRGDGDDLRVRQHLPHRRRSAELPRRPRRLRHRDGAQVTSHFLLLALFAFLVSIVFAVLMRDDPRQQIRTAGDDVRGFRRDGRGPRLADVPAAAVTGFRLASHPLKRLLLWGPPCGYMGLIFFASSVPGDQLPGHFWDKLAHLLVYAVLGVLFLVPLAEARLSRVTVRAAATAVLLSTLYGAFDEVHQSFTPGRARRARPLRRCSGRARRCGDLLLRVA